MSLPTRDQLHAEVDRRFAAQFPDAPARLDPGDPAQASWVSSWLSLRDAVLNDWVDAAFAAFFPHAGTLDPNNPDDDQLIQYWLDIRNQIRDGVPGQWSWDGDQALHVRSVEHDPAGGWRVIFDRPATVDEAGAFLWSGGVPDGVQVTSLAPATVLLRGLSIEAVQSLHPDVADQITPGVLTADPPDPSGGASDAGSLDGGTDVELDLETENKITEYVEHALDGGHAIASTAEVVASLAEATAHVAGHAGRAAAVAAGATRVASVLGPIGNIFLVVWVGFQVIDAFRSERRSSYIQGCVYGLMWEALDEPDHLPKFEPGITYSAEEHQEAFVEGIAAGREKAQDPAVRNRIIIAVATLGLSSGMGDFYAANEVLSALWRSARERAPGDSDTDTIRWPVPYDRNPLVPQ